MQPRPGVSHLPAAHDRIGHKDQHDDQGSTKAVAVSSPSSNQARTCRSELVSGSCGPGSTAISCVLWVRLLPIGRRYYLWGALDLEGSALRGLGLVTTSSR